MSLVADTTTKGLWRSAIQPDAGVHALIIGISAYPHLEDGAGPWAPDSGGMGQLEVCAKTAARLFDWVKSAGAIAGAPVATCRLHLAPRPAEQANVQALTQGNYGSANFKSIREATEAWRDSLAAGSTDPHPNVAFFYFSGHGLEHVSRPSVLCDDILDPRSPGGPKNAVSFNALWQSVSTYGIDRALFFVDACRNVSELARTLHIVGEDVINPADYTNRWPDAVLWLQATRNGAFAYQLPSGPATFFGQALLEALEGIPPEYEPYDRTQNPWQLIFSDLESYIKQRVRELVAQQSATKIQLVQSSGNPYNGETVVAEKAGTEIVRGGSPPPPPPPPPLRGQPPTPAVAVEPSIDKLIASRSDKLLSTFSTATAKILEPLQRTARSHHDYHGDLSDFSVMHEIFHHESVTQPWVETLKILDVDSEQPAPSNIVTLAEGHSQERGGAITAWLDMRVEPREGKAVWVQAGGEEGRPWFAVAIPRDQNGPVPVRLDLEFRAPQQGWKWTLEGMSARLAPPRGFNSDLQRIWNALWEVQRVETLSDLARAGRAAGELVMLEDALREKMKSPVASAIAAGLLLRAGALGYLHRWPRNLANWFDWLADGPVLWSETIIRRSEILRQNSPIEGSRPGAAQSSVDEAKRLTALVSQPAYIEAREYFAKVGQRGPPLLTSSLVMAARQSLFWRRVLETDAFSGSERIDLAAACDTIDRPATYAASDGVFAGFISRDKPLMPHDVIGMRQRVRIPA